jgi:type II secretory pathway pseudopilin PulG
MNVRRYMRWQATLREAGFTYLWTLFAVALMGVGMMLGAELWATTVKREREADLIHAGRQFRDAIGRYYESTPGGAKQYPPSLEELMQDSRFPALRRHLRKVFADPVTGKPDWGLVRINGRIVGVHSRSPDAPMKIAGFELTESSFHGREKYSEWVFTYPYDLLLRPEAKAKTTPGSKPASPESDLQFPPLVVKEIQPYEPKP